MTSSVIGVMSGSSLDGLDMALCFFENHEGALRWSIRNAQTVPYSATWENRLRNAHHLGGKELMELDADFGKYIGETIAKWCGENKIEADLIASHGHTVFHEPQSGFTTQIGSGAHIAFQTRTDTITDFRSADIAAGGQGAPFAPIVDRDLFSGYDGFLNLGGISNLTVKDQSGQWVAGDISPCNQALNFLALRAGLPFDENGNLAAEGRIIEDVQSDLEKSFRKEKLNEDSISNARVEQTWIHYLTHCTLEVKDLLATTSEVIAALIVDTIAKHTTSSKRILVTGGGAHNGNLMARLNKLGSENNFHFEKPEDQLVDYKECLLMAYLGACTLKSKPYGINNLTGAVRDSIGGAFYKAV